MHINLALLHHQRPLLAHFASLEITIHSCAANQTRLVKLENAPN